METKLKIIAINKKLLEIKQQLEAVSTHIKEVSGIVRISEDRILTEDSDVTPSVWDKLEFSRIRLIEAGTEISRALTKITEAVKLS